MGVRDLIAKQKIGFISLREVLDRMRKDGSAYHEVAGMLHNLLREESERKIRLSDRPRFYTCYPGTEPRLADRDDMERALSCLLTLGDPDLTGSFCLGRYVFMIAEIIPFLESREIDIREIPKEFEPMESSLFPEWKQNMALASHFTNEDGAFVLAGVNPEHLHQTSQVERDAFFDHFASIYAAIEAEEIPAELISKENGQKTWNIRPADLIAWSEEKGFFCPLPKSPAFPPATDAGLRETLANREQELKQLKARVQELESSKEKEIERLTSENKKLTSQLEGKKKIPDGRSEASYLRIIGALLEYIHGETPETDKHPSFTNQTGLVKHIAKYYKGYEGLSESNLARKFPAALRRLRDI